MYLKLMVEPRSGTLRVPEVDGRAAVGDAEVHADDRVGHHAVAQNVLIAWNIRVFSYNVDFVEETVTNKACFSSEIFMHRQYYPLALIYQTSFPAKLFAARKHILIYIHLQVGLSCLY